jgi:hypothetical protein
MRRTILINRAVAGIVPGTFLSDLDCETCTRAALVSLNS